MANGGLPISAGPGAFVPNPALGVQSFVQGAQIAEKVPSTFNAILQGVGQGIETRMKMEEIEAKNKYYEATIEAQREAAKARQAKAELDQKKYDAEVKRQPFQDWLDSTQRLIQYGNLEVAQGELAVKQQNAKNKVDKDARNLSAQGASFDAATAFDNNNPAKGLATLFSGEGIIPKVEYALKTEQGPEAVATLNESIKAYKKRMGRKIKDLPIDVQNKLEAADKLTYQYSSKPLTQSQVLDTAYKSIGLYMPTTNREDLMQALIESNGVWGVDTAERLESGQYSDYVKIGDKKFQTVPNGFAGINAGAQSKVSEAIAILTNEARARRMRIDLPQEIADDLSQKGTDKGTKTAKKETETKEEKPPVATPIKPPETVIDTTSYKNQLISKYGTK